MNVISDKEAFEKLRPHFEVKENRLHAARESFLWFCLLYFPQRFTIPMGDFQREMFDLSMEERLLIVMPRGYGKSVVWSEMYPLWVLLNNPYNLDLHRRKEDVFMISNTANLAEKWIRSHKASLTDTSSLLYHDYKPSQGNIWRNDEIEIVVNGQLHGRIVARGQGAQVRGEHPTELLLDDLENREEAASEGPREKMREYFFQDLWGAIRHEDGNETRVKIVGTFVHPLALLPELYDKDWWTKRKYAVYKQDGSPLWPEYMNDEKLQELRSQMPETAWASEYMNQPIVSENPTFMRDWFKPYEPGLIRDASGQKITTHDMLIVTAIDPAISQRDSGDYTAIATFGATWDEKEPRVFCLDARRGHWTMSRQITELLSSYERNPGSIQLIEVVAYQKALYYEYKERLDREHLNIRVIEMERDKDKGRRANVVTPMFQRGWIHFDHGDRMQQILMDELALFDYSKRKTGRDDFVDVTVDCLTYIGEWFRRRRHGKKKGKAIIVRANDGLREDGVAAYV